MSKAMWGGRFSKSTDEMINEFQASINFDKRMYHEDIAGSIAHATMLAKCGIITEDDRDKIIAGLKDILQKIEQGNFEFSVDLEDIHMNIEKRLTDAIGEAGGRLHTARSRNDQVALDTHMYVRREVVAVQKEIENLQRALVETRTQCEALQQALDTARERSSAAQSVLAALTGKRDALRAQIQAAPPADIAALRTRRDALTVRAEQLQRQISTCDARLEQNRAARTAIDTRRQQHAAVRARWQWVHALAATANGTVPGKEKIMLETYIQTAYFDRILGRANTRLLIMSGGQYELRRCARAGDNRSQTGLELEVIDHYNGTARSVKTLSGGETFAASLSLALGLSDEVQATAGGVQLEAMFVDEGFGSLDSEALQQALAALVGVSGGSRIVGIISHVAELKDRIDRQIIVTKDRSGGSRVQVQA